MSDGSTIVMGTTRGTERTGGFPRHDILVEDEMHCASCGRIIKRAAAFCVHCGVLTSSDPFNRRPAVPCGPKRKRVAILLALFLGYWTWYYTIAVDWWRFVVCLITQVVLIGLLATITSEGGLDHGDGPGFCALAALISIGVCWLWPLIHTGRRRPQFFYHEYPQAE